MRVQDSDLDGDGVEGGLFLTPGPLSVGTYLDCVKRRRWWSVVGLWVVWWAAITAVFAGLGMLFDQPTSLARCAASAVLVIVVGEVGDRLRRRFLPRRETG